MKKIKISKIIISILTFLLIVCISTNVFADDLLDFDKDFPGQTPSTDPEPTPSTDPEPTPSTDPEPTPEPEQKAEEKMPYAGPEENALMVTAFIAFAVIGIYTFVKLSDYSNI